MKFLTILAALSLALAPIAVNAGSATPDQSAENDRPISGPLAGRVLSRSEVPVGAIIVGTAVIFMGVMIGVLASGGTDSNNDTNNVPN